MSSAPGASTQSTRVVRAEAAAWLAKLHSPDCPADIQAGFRRWIGVDQTHAQAFERLTDSWETSGAIPAKALKPASHGNKATPLVRHLGLAIAATAAVAIGIAYYAYQSPSFATMTGEQRSIGLSDGSRVFMNTGSRIRIDFDRQARRVHVEGGEVFFEVAKNPTRPFRVIADGREIAVLGTSFLVRSEPRHLAVTLVEGSVAVAPTGARRGAVGKTPIWSILKPGQRLTIDSTSEPSVDVPRIEELLAWRQGNVVFDDVLLGDAVQEMNRYSRTPVQIIEPGARDLRISGIFRAGESEAFARVVAQMYGLGLDSQPESITLTGLAKKIALRR